MGVRHAEAFGDSLLVMQQVFGVYQCFDEYLNVYLDKCLEIIAIFNDFTVQNVSRDENIVAKDLAHQALGFRSSRGKLYVLEKSDVPVSQTI
jgi:small nuclear ribonucleoprotein (snRNP)-like protein